jgi:hypothetical protein
MFEDPNKVLVPIEGLEWNPETPVAEAVKLAEEALKATIDSIEFKVELKGTFAYKYHFIKVLLSSLGMPDNEIDNYILYSGIESQFRKLAESANTTKQS